jgi:fumarate reductase subunit D
METGATPPSEAAEGGYDGAAVAGAVLATLFFPIIALIAALLLQGGQQDPRKKAQLRTWAWASGAFLAVGVVLFTVLASVTL